MSILDTFTQHPDERQDYDLSFQAYLARHADAIQAAEVLPVAGLTVGPYAFQGGVVKVFLSGGQPRHRYIVTVRVTTHGGRIRRGSIAIRVKAPPCIPTPEPTP